MREEAGLCKKEWLKGSQWKGKWEEVRLTDRDNYLGGDRQYPQSIAAEGFFGCPKKVRKK